MKNILIIAAGIALMFLLLFILIALVLIGEHVWTNIFDGDGRDG